MDFVHKLTKPLMPFVVLAFLGMSLFVPVANAEMISTQTMLDKQSVAEKRRALKQLLQRKEIVRAFKMQGVDATEAQTRIDSMTDAEVMKLASRLDKMPAGAGGEALLLILLIIIILEATGVTNIFTFV